MRIVMNSTPKVIYAYASDDAQERIGIPAQTAGEELDRIRRRDGHIAPRVVVDEARPEDAPLHPAFEWRDEVAAENWREHEARQLVRQVRVITPPVERTPEPRVCVPNQQRRPAVESEEFDPLAADLSRATGSLVETQRQLEQLRHKAAARFDRKRVIAADVALAELAEAKENLAEAHEALTAARKESCWSRTLAGNLVGS